MMRAILIFITAIYYTLPQLMTDPTAINRLITTSPFAHSVSEKSAGARALPAQTMGAGGALALPRRDSPPFSPSPEPSKPHRQW